MIIKKKRKTVVDGGPDWSSISKEESKVIEKKFTDDTEGNSGEKTSALAGKAAGGTALGLAGGYGLTHITTKTGQKYLNKRVNKTLEGNLKDIYGKWQDSSKEIVDRAKSQIGAKKASYEKSIEEGGNWFQRLMDGKVSKGELRKRINNEIGTVSKEAARDIDKLAEKTTNRMTAANRLANIKKAGIAKRVKKINKGLMIGGALAGTGIALASSYRNKKKNEK